MAPLPPLDERIGSQSAETEVENEVQCNIQAEYLSNLQDTHNDNNSGISSTKSEGSIKVKCATDLNAKPSHKVEVLINNRIYDISTLKQ